MTHFQKVSFWHKTFGVPVGDKPAMINTERVKLRLELIREELRELEEAFESGDLVAAADACADLEYVVLGTAAELGLPHDAIFDEVHRSNMSKVWDDGTVHYRADGKVLKPPTYSPANIAIILNQ